MIRSHYRSNWCRNSDNWVCKLSHKSSFPIYHCSTWIDRNYSSVLTLTINNKWTLFIKVYKTYHGSVLREVSLSAHHTHTHKHIVVFSRKDRTRAPVQMKPYGEKYLLVVSKLSQKIELTKGWNLCSIMKDSHCKVCMRTSCSSCKMIKWPFKARFLSVSLSKVFELKTVDKTWGWDVNFHYTTLH